MTKELVETLHQHGKIVCVWVDKDYNKENAEIWCHVYDLGIDSYCTDYPLIVLKVWNNYKKLL